MHVSLGAFLVGAQRIKGWWAVTPSIIGYTPKLDPRPLIPVEEGGRFQRACMSFLASHAVQQNLQSG
jgi:hypothetical protein